MNKRITDNQLLGELGETAVRKLVLGMGFIYEPRGRLEAGTDGIIELRDPKNGTPLGKACQHKSGNEHGAQCLQAFQSLVTAKDMTVFVD